MKHNIQEQLIGKSIMRCIAILAVLLMTFVLEASAQKYYVIYYDDTSTNPATRHYLSINEDGKSINDETALSARCYWVADNSLKEADGNWGEYQNTEHSNYTNRLPLYSYAHKKKYLDGTGGQNDAKNGNNCNFNLTTSSSKRWLIKYGETNVPVYFSYNYMHYVFYDEGAWKYSSGKRLFKN